jgi:hypothetical protein
MSARFACVVQTHLSCGTTKHVLAAAVVATKSVCGLVVASNHAFVFVVASWHTGGSVANWTSVVAHCCLSFTLCHYYSKMENCGQPFLGHKKPQQMLGFLCCFFATLQFLQL